MIKKDDDGEKMKEDNPQLDAHDAHQVVEENHRYFGEGDQNDSLAVTNVRGNHLEKTDVVVIDDDQKGKLIMVDMMNSRPGPLIDKDHPDQNNHYL